MKKYIEVLNKVVSLISAFGAQHAGMYNFLVPQPRSSLNILLLVFYGGFIIEV